MRIRIGRRILDKKTGGVKLLKVFARLFQKAARWRARSPPRPPQRAKFPYRRSLLQAFLLRLLPTREKRLRSLCKLTNHVPFVYTLGAPDAKPYRVRLSFQILPIRAYSSKIKSASASTIHAPAAIAIAYQ